MSVACTHGISVASISRGTLLSLLEMKSLLNSTQAVVEMGCPSEVLKRHGVERQGKSSTCMSCYGRLIVRAVDPMELFIGSGASTAPDTGQ